jgi:hypothetical protein
MGRTTFATGAALALALAAGLVGVRSHHAGLPRPGRVDALTLAPSGAAAPHAIARRTSWCGTTSPTDRPAAATGYAVRVYYVVPLDGPDQSATAAPQIAGYIDAIDAWWQREDPSRMPRFDLYSAPCGPQLDINTFRSSAISVASTNGNANFSLLWNEFNTRPDARYTKYLLFVDDVNTGNLCGVGGTALGSTLGSPSMGLATVYLQGCNGADRASTAVHEFLHTITPSGGFPSAPHTCPNDLLHVCDSSGDVLYPYAEYGIPISSLQLDVNHDDYYAGTAPVNLQVQPWLKHVQEQVHLALKIGGPGTVTSDLPGLQCTATCDTDWDSGAAIALTATAADGYRFVGWSGGCKDSGDIPTCALTMSGPMNVTAQFAPAQFPLAVSVKGTGSVSTTPRAINCKRATCKVSLTSFVPVLLTAKPAKGWRFSGWTGACHGTKATCRVPMSAATAVHAAFARTKKR